jgi:hypothetical protein
MGWNVAGGDRLLPEFWQGVMTTVSILVSLTIITIVFFVPRRTDDN